MGDGASRAAETEEPRDLAAVVRALRACRVTREVEMEVTPFGLTYWLSAAIWTAIATLADRPTGQRGYSSQAGATDGRRAGQARAGRDALGWRA